MTRFSKYRGILIGALLVAVTLIVFAQTFRFDFIAIDDGLYVVHNEHVNQGLTRDGIRWALTSVAITNWLPVTMLSHIAATEAFGLNPGAHHAVNVVIHILTAVLLFWVFRRMTAAFWPSALVAILFAIHPLHVESVAWISERKDVLSGFFWVLTMAAYLGYAERRTKWRYVVVAGVFVLGLLSKPMNVTLPFVLLLLDYWPVGRFDPREPARWRAAWRLAAEKLPLIVISVAFSVLTYYTQAQEGAVQGTRQYPLYARLANAIHAYGMYLYETFVPVGLVPQYPHPGADLPWVQVAVAGVAVTGLTALAVAQWRRRPWLFVGWFWYLGTLAPVIGVVQVAHMARADRYTYIPQIGVFIMIAWTLGELAARSVAWRRTAALAACAGVFALTAAAYVQTAYWRDNMTLFTRTLEVSPNSAQAHYAVGVAYAERGAWQEAEDHFRMALEYPPPLAEAHSNFAAVLYRRGATQEAAEQLREAVEIMPDNPELQVNYGVALLGLGRAEDALVRANLALALQPGHARASALQQACRDALAERAAESGR